MKRERKKYLIIIIIINVIIITNYNNDQLEFVSFIVNIFSKETNKQIFFILFINCTKLLNNNYNNNSNNSNNDNIKIAFKVKIEFNKFF